MDSNELNTKIAILERSLERERLGRKKAEEILRTKAMELYQTNTKLSAMQSRLQLALWAGQEVVWEYFVDEDEYYLYQSFEDNSAQVARQGNFEYVVGGYHVDDQDEFRRNWFAHLSDESPYFDIKLRRLFSAKGVYRWVSVRGRKIIDERSGKPSKVIGIVKDIHDEYMREAAYKTISNSFVSSQDPGFIIDYSMRHVEVSDSFLITFGLSRDDIKRGTVSQADLIACLPVETIKEQQSKHENKFSATISLNSNDIKCDILLAPLLESDNHSQKYRYAVGFFRSQK